MKFSPYVLILAIIFCSCAGENDSVEESESRNTESYNHEKSKSQILQSTFEGPLNTAFVDTLAMAEMRMWLNDEGQTMSVWELYNNNPEDDYATWSQRLFGRCCTEADLRYTERLYFNVSAPTIDTDYPDEYLHDIHYNTAYVFKETDAVEITLQLQTSYPWLEEGEEVGEKHISEKMSSGDTLMRSFQITLINGYAKSKELFEKNSRVRKMEVWLNDERMCDVELQDIPEAQTIYGDFPVLKNDKITLKPYSYYEGSAYDDVCISEFQTCLGDIGNPDLDRRYTPWWEN